MFESYKPFNGQGGSRLLLLTVHDSPVLIKFTSFVRETKNIFLLKLIYVAKALNQNILHSSLGMFIMLIGEDKYLTKQLFFFVFVLFCFV